MSQQVEIPVFRPLDDAGLNASLHQALAKVLDSRWYILGQQVSRFESEFAEYCGSAHCVSLANGTDALEIGLRALGVEKGDRVALVANAGFYGSCATHAIGAVPLYVEVDPATLTMCPDSLAKALAQRPKAVLVTHLYGMLADLDRILELTIPFGIPVLEDCAQAHGAQRDGRKAGTRGKIGCFSFYPTKNLGALGDGGAVICDDSELAQRVRELRQYGWSNKYQVTRLGGRNSRLDELQAAALSTKLPWLDSWNAQRREIASQYHEKLSDSGLVLPPSLGLDYVAHLYVVRSPQREHLRAELRTGGIATEVHYPIPDFAQTAYSDSEVSDLPITRGACQEVLTLPCFPGMTAREADRVIARISESLSRSS